ncbi:MAG: hypothetical protein UR46_C0031G0010 [Parcubacteria group bacterium GW2011_GWA1_33_6]|nr:MAG: hypothetical protein UR46_C0031G0010 [Parcubacteria group bacterium GW2011_GWA1_33_6]
MDPIITIFSLVILLFSVIIHELAHGYIAYSLGDPTAKYAGRLTLNPIKHLDPFGSVILPLILFISGSPILFGWAKPVPVNPYNFKDQKWGSLKVAIAGPITNIALAIFFGLLIRFIPSSFFISFPGMFLMFSYIVTINLVLAIFNLIPIPPLDGFWILFKFIPQKFEKLTIFLHQYGIFILIFLIFFGALQNLIFINNLFFSLITGI